MNNILLDGYENLKEDTKIDIDFKKYFKIKDKIKSIETEIEKFTSYNLNLQRSINNTNVNLSYDISGIQSGEKVTTSANGDSYFEKELIQKISRIELSIEQNKEKIIELIAHKNSLMLKISNINVFIGTLNEEYKNLLLKRYSKDKTLLEIGIETSCSEGNVRKQIIKIKDMYRAYINC